MVEPVKVGVVGCGDISARYFRVMRTFDNLDVVACADLKPERARARAQEFGIPRASMVDELLADPEIEIVVNLTVPLVHAQVAEAALRAGKHVYNEKPLATTRDDGRRLLDLAQARGLRLGCAPDTVLGGGLQTCRRLIDAGAIGQPVAGVAFMLNHGHEHWHPSPAFYYQPGGGPLFDMGPYYLSALVNLLGPVRRVASSARITFPERFITSEPKRGQTVPVTTPTHISGVLDFAGGALVTLTMSFDVWAHSLPGLEIYGTDGSLRCPDPNTFRGPVLLRQEGEREWREIPLMHGYTEEYRGLGVADMAQAIRAGTAHRASGDVAYHVLDTMQALIESSDANRHIELTSTCERPLPMPPSIK